MAYSERYCDAATGSNLNGGFPIGGAYPVTSTGGTFTQAGGASGNDRFAAAAGTPFSGCAVDDCVSVYADGASAPTGYVGVITAINGGGASIDLHITRFAGTRLSTGGSRTAVVGGAWKGPNGASMFPWGFVTNVLTNAALQIPHINFKNGTDYAVSFTTGTTGVTHSLAGPVVWEGYDTTPGDGSLTMTLPKITGSASDLPYRMMVVSGTRHSFKYLEFALNGQDSPGPNANGDQLIQTTSGASSFYAYRCRFTESWRDGIRTGGAASLLVECEGNGCNVDAANTYGQFNAVNNTTYIRCVAHHSLKPGDAGAPGFAFQAGTGIRVNYEGCIAAHNEGQGWWNVTGAAVLTMRNCVAYGNGLAGVELVGSSASQVYIENCIFVGNGEAGIRWLNAGFGGWVTNCFFYDNTNGNFTNSVADMISGTVDLSGDPFDDATNGDFELNNDAGAGADVRNAGIGTFLMNGSSPDGSYSEVTVSYPDGGAAQHEETATGGASSYTFG